MEKNGIRLVIGSRNILTVCIMLVSNIPSVCTHGKGMCGGFLHQVLAGSLCVKTGFLLFTSLYLILLLKINLLILLKEPSMKKALLTLHVTTETHYLL